MIIRLLLLIALPLIAYWAAQKIAQRVTLSRAQYRWLIVSIAALMAVAVLIALGRVPFQFILAPLGLAATTLFRALPALLRVRRKPDHQGRALPSAHATLLCG
jgi:hypothetical protein